MPLRISAEGVFRRPWNSSVFNIAAAAPLSDKCHSYFPERMLILLSFFNASSKALVCALLNLPWPFLLNANLPSDLPFNTNSLRVAMLASCASSSLNGSRETSPITAAFAPACRVNRIETGGSISSAWYPARRQVPVLSQAMSQSL